MVSKVRYGGPEGTIEPAPFLGLSKVYNRQPDGSKLSSIYTIRLVGDLLAFRGSPDKDGDLYTGTGHAPIETVLSDARLAAITRKIEAFDNLFRQDYKKLSWQSADGSQDAHCYPRVVNFDFQPNVWFNRAPYDITLETHVIYGEILLSGEFSELLASATESWDFNPNGDNETFSVRHTISAAGLSASGENAFSHAFDYVSNNLGFDLTKVGVSSSGDIDFSTYGPYNHIREEVRDEPSASYSVVESWILAPKTYFENYTKSLQITTDGDATKTVSIQGSIQGFYENLNGYSGAYIEASGAWGSIQGSLLSRAETLSSGVKFKSASVDHNELEGSISYVYTYDNRSVESGVIDDYTINRRYDSSNYRTIVSLEGNIQGQLEDPNEDKSLRYDRALSWWTHIYPDLYNRVSGYVDNLKQLPLTRQVSDNRYQGSISYNYEFDTREFETYVEEFSVSTSYSRDNGITSISVNGTIQGLSEGSGILDRFMNASGAMPSDSDIYARAQIYYPGYFSSNIIGKEIAYAPYAGTIVYTYQYNNEPANLFPNSISEVVNVSDTNSSEVIPVIPILGSSPVLQNISTRTEKRRSIGLELLFLPATGSTYLELYGFKPDTNSFVSGLAPANSYKIQDIENYSLKTRRYTRNVDYVY